MEGIRWNSGDPKVNQYPVPVLVRQEKAYGRQSCMYGLGKSDDLIVCAGQRTDQEGLSPSGSLMEGAISKGGGNASSAAGGRYGET